MSTNKRTPTAELPSTAFLERFAHRFFAAFNAQDVVALVSLCAEDVVIEDPSLPEPLYGRPGAETFLAANFRAFPDGRVTPLTAAYTARAQPDVLVPYRFSGTMSGDWEPTNIAATGAPVSFTGIDCWRFAGEHLIRWGTTYDALDVARQMGVLPARGSRMERLATRLQHLQVRLAKP